MSEVKIVAIEKVCWKAKMKDWYYPPNRGPKVPCGVQSRLYVRQFVFHVVRVDFWRSFVQPVEFKLTKK